jgi:hypothetical protein
MYGKYGKTLSNGAYVLTDGSSVHQAYEVWYGTKLDITSFTTEFTFQNGAVGGVPGNGMTFVIYNGDSTTNPGNGGGLNNEGDANGLGYFCYTNCPNTSQYQERYYKSVAIKFDMSSQNGANYPGAKPEATGLYLNGGPGIDNGAIPENSLVPTGINMYLGDLMKADVVYDGSILTMVLTDTVTGASTRYSWPVDIPAVTGANTAYVGMTAGNTRPVTSLATEQTFNSWVWYHGYAQQLAAPTFSVASGQYTGTQTVSINGPAGATIYYTTNGQPPTAASNVYSSPLKISATEDVQAVAIESNFRDSSVANAYYQIGTGTYPIDFSGGFSGYTGILNILGAASLNGSALQLTDETKQREVSAVWNVAPVSISSFTTEFTLKFPAAQSHAAAGTVFTIQNFLPPADDASSTVVTGGPYTLGGSSGISSPLYFGYYGIKESVGIKFDLSNNSTSVLTNGADPSASSVAITDVNLSSGDPIAVQLSYSGTTLAMSITDSVTMANYTHNFTVDIPSVVGANSAYVGFTASTGFPGDYAQQEITSWTYQN